MTTESDSTRGSSKAESDRPDAGPTGVPSDAAHPPLARPAFAFESGGGKGGAPEGRPESDPDDAPDAGKKKKKKKKGKKSADTGAGRGVETMFRTSYRTHLDLSSLADAKANIMISINGIMISVVLGTLYDEIAANRVLLLPAAVLVLGCLGSLVYAVVAARPRVTHRSVTLEDVRENRANILFFGNFVNMSEEDFLTGMWELMGDRERTYTNMMRDLFGLGTVLEKKYRLLRVSYTIFMIGLVLGVLLFLGVFATASPEVVGF